MMMIIKRSSVQFYVSSIVSDTLHSNDDGVVLCCFFGVFMYVCGDATLFEHDKTNHCTRPVPLISPLHDE